MRGVYEWKLSEKSKKANAALMGMGRTRRIILADTLLQNYSEDEIEAVLAHELGHHVRRHIVKGILMQVGITFFGFWLTNQVLRYALARDWFPVLDPRLYDFANLPLIILVATVLGFLLMPAFNALSRKHEREADLYAWESISAIGPVCYGHAEAGRPEPRRAHAVALAWSGSSSRIRRFRSGSLPRKRGTNPSVSRIGETLAVEGFTCVRSPGRDPEYPSHALGTSKEVRR